MSKQKSQKSRPSRRDFYIYALRIPSIRRRIMMIPGAVVISTCFASVILIAVSQLPGVIVDHGDKRKQVLMLYSEPRTTRKAVAG